MMLGMRHSPTFNPPLEGGLKFARANFGEGYVVKGATAYPSPKKLAALVFSTLPQGEGKEPYFAIRYSLFALGAS